MPDTVYEKETDKCVRVYETGIDVEIWIDGAFVCLQSELMDKPLKIPISSVGSLKQQAIEKEQAHFLTPE